MTRYIYTGMMVLALAMVVTTTDVRAAETTPKNTAALEQIQALMAKLEELQKQMATIRGEVKTILNSQITEGSTSDDVKKIQELLATDPTIYPGGKVTGFYGPMTKEAIKRFQERHGLTVTGVVDEETKKFLEEYLKEGPNGKIAPGLLRAPGMMKKIEDRVRLKCDNSGRGKGVGPLCERTKPMDSDDDTEDEDMSDNEEDEESEDADTDKKATPNDALKAIAKATKAVMDAQREIRKSENDDETAKELLADARAKLTEAREARVSRDFAAAFTLAEEATDIAEDARDAVNEEDAEDEDEDEDEEEDDEDDEDDEDEDEE